MDDTGDAVTRMRAKLSPQVQLSVFFRDGWLCRWCHRPVVFAPALRCMELLVRSRGRSTPLAYFSLRWRRDASPLLDHLGAVIDHVDAFSKGGVDDVGNFATACNKCNGRKGAGQPDPGRPVKGKYGEPAHWDGFTTLFFVLAPDHWSALSKTDRKWHAALQQYLGESTQP